MIIFDLDGTLADCEHRRHFIMPHSKEWEEEFPGCFGYVSRNKDGSEFDKPDWQAFYEACGEDTIINPVWKIWNQYETDIACNYVE